MNTMITYTLNDLTSRVAQLKELMHDHRVFAFTGSLGAGKTTLIRSLLQTCGVTGIISSPTFTYVNIYQVNGKKLYHFDLYRLTSAQEFIDAGFDEYLYDQQACIFIEWPEIIASLLPKHTCFVALDYVDAGKRSLHLSFI